jgi:hypothetical protein
MKRFLAAAAMAPLCFAAMEARAQTTINDARTTPVQTSTTGNLTIDAAGSIKVPSGAAVTVDSASTVINNGVIELKDGTSAATGILVTSGSGNVTSAGTINVTDSEELKDTDGDGDIDGPFVTSTAQRYGIHVVGPFTGSVTQAGGQIFVRGNNSALIAIDNAFTGDLTLRGQAAILGTNTFGVRFGGPVTGTIDIGGSLSAQGEAAEGVSIVGPVTGRLILQGQVVASGYRYLTRNLAFELSKLDADDLLLGGPAVRISDSITGGVLVNASQLNTDDLDPDDDSNTPAITDPNPDEDGDGIADANETDGSITAFGSAPGILIAGPGAIALGNVGAGSITGYGLVIQGTVVGNGLFDGFSATAIRLGGGGGTVTTGNGINIPGTVFSSSVLANSNALVLDAGASAPTAIVSGRLQAQGTSNGTLTPTVTALEVKAGASLGSVVNSGVLQAQISGTSGTATAVLDSAGSISQITNTGAIAGSLAQVNATDVITGRGIALDLRANTTGVSVLQTHPTVELVTPAIVGDILFGSGNATLDIREGSVTGDVAFGSGTNTLVLNGTKTTTTAATDTTPATSTTVVNGSITGKLTNAGALSASILSGSLINTFAGSVNMTDLTVGADGVLGFTLDPAAGGSTRYNVAGAANLAAGSSIDILFASKLASSQTFTLIDSSGLNIGGLDTSLLGDTPFVYKTALSTTPTQLNVTVGRRSAAEAGLFGSRAAAFDPIFAAFDSDAGVSRALLGKTDEAGFAEFYNQLLPDYSGGGFHSLASGTREVMRAQADEPAGMQTNQRRSWLQEVGFSNRNKGTGSASDVPYDAAGFGVAGGIEEPMRNGAVRGLSLALVSSDVDNANRRGFSQLTASALLGSVYWRDQLANGLTLDASLTGGYTWFDSDRHVIDVDSTGARILQRQAGGKWSGAIAAGRLGVVYEIPAGRFYFRPNAVVDYVYLYEDGYKERGGGAAVDLAVDHRTSYEAAAEAGVTVGARFGRGFRWGPEVHVGYRTNLGEGLSETSARFLAGGNQFVLRALGVDKSRLVLRAAIRGGSRYANVALEGTGDIGDVYSAYEGRLVVRFIF